MKKIDKLQRCTRAIMAWACFALLLGSCTKNDIDSQPVLPDFLTVTATVADEISFAANSSNKFLVEANTPWQAEVTQGEEWCSLSGYSSSELSLEVEVYILAEANISTESRTAKIVVSADGVANSEEITVVQMGYGAAIVLSESALSVLGVEGSTATFTVTSTSEWSIDENEYFSFDPSQGEGDPYMTEDPVLVTATAKSTNQTEEDIVTTMTISNADGKEASLEFTQQVAVSLDFADASAISASPDGETLRIEVVTDSDAWAMYCDNSLAKIDYSLFESEGVVLVTLEKNITFAARSMTLSLKTDDGYVSSSENITLTQESKNGTFNYISYMTGTSSATVDSATGALTIDNVGGLKARISSNDSIYGMGTYTIDVEKYVGVSNSYVNIQAENSGPDRINVAIGPTSTTSVIRNAAGTIFQNPVITPTLDNLQSMTKMVFSVLPDATDASMMNVVVKLSNDSGTIYDYSTQMTNYYSANASFVNDLALYFGICADSAPSASGTNYMVISGFEFEEYDPSAVVPDPDDDSDADNSVNFGLFTDKSYLNGEVTLLNDGAGMTLTHTSGASSRVAYSTTDLGFGTYNLIFSDYQGSADTYFNMQFDINGLTTDRVILNIGPGAGVTIVKVNGTVVNNVTIAPTLAQLESMERLEITLLPKESDESRLVVTATLYDSASSVLYTQSVENINYDDSNPPYDILYMGVGGTSGQSITIDSFTYEPYSADDQTTPEEEDSNSVELDFATLNYTSYLNGSYSLGDNGSVTINHESGAQSRFTTDGVDGLAVFGMGTYTIKFSNFEGVSDAFINLQAICSTNSSGEQFNINIGPSASQSVLKSDQGVWAAVTTLKPTIAQLEAMTTLTISLLPVEPNPVNMNLTVSIDGEVLSSTGGITSFLNNENYLNNMNVYFGVGGGSTGSTITIDSFSYEPYEN